MARKPLRERFGKKRGLPLALGTYQVYDDAALEVGGVKVQVDKDKKTRTVQMSAPAAKYWIDQGIIGEKPLAELSEEGRNLITQGLGKSKPVKNDKAEKAEKTDEDPAPVPRKPASRTTHVDDTRG